MKPGTSEDSLRTLQDIKSIMERSARFLSLSGWSGIWAGAVALAGTALAQYRLSQYYTAYNTGAGYENAAFITLRNQLAMLAAVVCIIAIAGGLYFTYRKNSESGERFWNNASKRIMISLLIPLIAGGIMILAFLRDNQWMYLVPVSLIFYGLALINGSKYTVSDIKYLGLLEVVLGCAALALPSAYGLYIWALGFGVLHIVYGVVMWQKYDRE
jgi:nitrate reductase gamma subunit